MFFTFLYYIFIYLYIYNTYLNFNKSKFIYNNKIQTNTKMNKQDTRKVLEKDEYFYMTKSGLEQF